MNLKWRRWMDAFNRLTSSLEQEIERIDEMGSYDWGLNDWETPHVHVLELMAPFDGLDFHKFPQHGDY